jgi:hypothetical protein
VEPAPRVLTVGAFGRPDAAKRGSVVSCRFLTETRTFDGPAFAFVEECVPLLDAIALLVIVDVRFGVADAEGNFGTAWEDESADFFDGGAFARFCNASSADESFSEDDPVELSSLIMMRLRFLLLATMRIIWGIGMTLAAGLSPFPSLRSALNCLESPVVMNAYRCFAQRVFVRMSVNFWRMFARIFSMADESCISESVLR